MIHNIFLLLEVNIYAEYIAFAMRICTPVDTLYGTTITPLVHFGIHARVMGECQKVGGSEIRLNTGNAEFSHPLATDIIRQRNILDTQIAAVFDEIGRIAHIPAGLGHVGDLTGNTPAAKYLRSLVFTVVHTFSLHTRGIKDVVAICALQENTEVKTFIRESIGHAESKVGVRVSDKSTVRR